MELVDIFISTTIKSVSHNMKTTTFEDYLKDIHAEQYEGLDDEMPDDFDSWFGNLDAQEMFDYAVEWGKTL